ncbi:response regulator transcription factor [Spirochaeta isovalerica]|uniref:DNA-binding NarL/FixJ family response regulator n=1 Tax=Spirochaeta isovalerica TaxID=150 RepID=A0A841RHC8_9SPIO|nr:response regulator transcription factor [Spirochaeta isovalerica]MBB6481702.1 DNA-binding NarL/FixJ family response regulator [Spirochaeta isovalerica]
MRNILIVDDHKLIFSGLKGEIPEDFRLLYAANSREALDLACQNPLAAAIIDITLGEENGFDLAEELKREVLVSQLFFLSMHKTPYFVQKAINEGYRGYFLKDDSLDLLIRAVSDPAGRKFWMSEEVEKMLNDYEDDEYSLYENLTAREQQIFRLLAEGVGYKEIAYKLNVSPKTVSVHRDNIMRKMKLDHQTELIKQAVKLRIITI